MAPPLQAKTGSGAKAGVKCVTCDTKYKDAATLWRHRLRLHSNFKGFQCHLCDAVLQMGMLSTHFNDLHNLDLPFDSGPDAACSLEDLIRRFGVSFDGDKLQPEDIVFDDEDVELVDPESSAKVKESRYLASNGIVKIKTPSLAPPYDCLECNTSDTSAATAFPTSNELLRHVMLSHSNLSGFGCDACDVTELADNPAGLQAHMTSNHGVNFNRWNSVTSVKNFNGLASFIQNYGLVKKPSKPAVVLPLSPKKVVKPLKIKLVNKNHVIADSENIDNEDNHVVNGHVGNENHLPGEMVTEDHADMANKSHKIKEDVNDKNLTCELCDKQFHGEQELTNHLVNDHHAMSSCLPLPDKEAPEAAAVAAALTAAAAAALTAAAACNICGKKFLNAAVLMRHKVTHHLRGFQCPACSGVLNSAGLFAKHLRTHHGIFEDPNTNESLGAKYGLFSEKGFEPTPSPDVSSSGSTNSLLQTSETEQQQQAKQQLVVARTIKQEQVGHYLDDLTCELCSIVVKDQAELQLHLRDVHKLGPPPPPPTLSSPANQTMPNHAPANELPQIEEIVGRTIEEMDTEIYDPVNTKHQSSVQLDQTGDDQEVTQTPDGGQLSFNKDFIFSCCVCEFTDNNSYLVQNHMITIHFPTA